MLNEFFRKNHMSVRVQVNNIKIIKRKKSQNPLDVVLKFSSGHPYALGLFFVSSVVLLAISSALLMLLSVLLPKA